MLFVMALNPPGGVWLAVNALTLWLVARFAAASLTSVAERRAAGLGTRGALPSGWDLATIVLSLGAMLLTVIYPMGVFQ